MINKKEKSIIFIFAFYTLSLAISKFGISLFGGILAILAIYIFLYRREKEEYSNVFIGIFLSGVLLQIFSLAGAKASLVFSYKNYFLLIFPLTVFYLRKINFSYYLLKFLEISVFIGILKSFYNFYKIYNLKYTANIRVDSFFDIGRWGIVLVLCLLLILPNLYKKNLFSWFVFITGIISLLLNNSRGPLLSLILGIFIYLILGKKIKIIAYIICIVGGLYFINFLKPTSFVEEFSKRVASIHVTNSGGNAARLFMWKENINYMKDSLKNDKRVFLFGTGIKNREKLFRKYLEEKIDYLNLKKDIKEAISFEDAHNSYLNMFVQTGVIYSTLYYLFLIYLTFKVLINYIKTKNYYILACLSSIGAFYFCGIFYGYSFTYETFLFFFIFSLAFIERLGEKNDIDIRG